jgi:hypothetical protein
MFWEGKTADITDGSPEEEKKHKPMQEEDN